MKGYNKVIIMGNLTRDVELRYIPNGTAVATFTVAINEQWKDRTTGESRETTVFADVEVWRRMAEVCDKYLHKGSQVFVEGRLKQDRWKTQDGQNRSKMLISADGVQFLDSKKEQQAQNAARNTLRGDKYSSDAKPKERTPAPRAVDKPAPVASTPDYNAEIDSDGIPF